MRPGGRASLGNASQNPMQAVSDGLDYIILCNGMSLPLVSQAIAHAAGKARSEAMPARPGRTLPAGRYFELSTDRVGPTDRRAFWRDMALNRSEPDFPSGGETRGFAARVRGFAGVASELREGRSAGLTLLRTASRCRQDGGDEIVLSGIIASEGLAQYRSGDAAFTVPVGRLLINDM